MDERQYEGEVDKLLLTLESALDNASLDYESQEGLLTLYLADNQQAILSQQRALHEIWLAAPQGAFHFYFTPQGWVTRQGQSLLPLLGDILGVSLC